MTLLPDLGELLSFSISPLELVLRGSLMYWALFLMLRFVLRRDTGSIGVPDILLLVLIADAAQNAMSGGYETVAEGIVLVATLVGWNWLMDWASFRFNRVRRFIEPPPLVLIRHGHLIPRNMRREYVTVPELMASLRSHGIDKLADVKIARMEPDGGISVIRESKAGDDNNKGPDRKHPLPL